MAVKRQWFHSNSFKFLKKGNLAIISDYNTIGNVPISGRITAK
jgi:hypothetical protein